MSQKFKSDIETQAGLIDSFGFTGTAGQVLSSTGTKTEWITPPQSPGGGGSSQVFYFNGGTASSVGGYYQMSPVANTGTGADFTINANGYIASFLTDVASPNQLNIPAGNWNFEIYFSASSSGGSPSFYVELYKYSSGGVFTLIASSSATPEDITNGTAIDAYFTPLAVPTTTLLATDRLAVRVYVTHSGRTIKMHTQNGHLSEVITTFSTGLTALNGLTEQVQYFSTGTTGTDFNIASAVNTHTFNLPTASAINRGALSSADWTTFNSKANASGTTNYVSKFTGATTLGNSLIFDNGTNVGIGTTGPSYKLDVQSGQLRVLSGNPSNPALIIGEAGGPGTTNQGTLQFGDATSTFKIQAGNDYAGMIFTVGSERMRILSNGYVGIGTTSPSQKLTVSGGQTLLDQLQYTRAIDITGADLNSLVTAGFYNGPSLTNAPGGNSGWFWITVETYSGDNNWVHQTATTFGSGNTANEVYTRTRTSGTWTNWKRFIDWGDISGTTNYVSKFTGNNSLGNSLIYDNGTNVGIGTTTPSTKLQINVAPTGTQDDGMRVTDGTRIIQTNIVGDTYNYRSVGPNETMLYSTGNPLNIVSDGQPIKFTAGISEKMRITSTGNVGIGTTTPSEKLDVYGVIRGVYTADPGAVGAVTAKLLSYSPSPYGIVFRGYSSGAHSIQVQRESNVAQVYPLGLQPLGGSVGIGTITPAKLLDVNGDALINTLTVGRGTGNQIYNTVLGYQSLFNNTTGNDNVAIGYQTLLTNTTGNANVGMGVAALKLTTTGVANTAIGTVTLFNNTTGEGNTAIGYSAGNQSTGSRNIFIGAYTAYQTTASDYTTVIGGYLNAKATVLNESQTLSIEKPDTAVNNYLGEFSGLPHIWSPQTVVIGDTAANDLVELDYLLYSSIFMEYNLEDTNGNARAGTIKAVWDQTATTIKVTEEATDDIGNTSGCLISFVVGGGLIQIRLTNNNGYTVYCNTTSRILIRPTIQIL